MRFVIPMILASIALLGCPNTSVSGFIFDAGTGLPIPGAQVGFFRNNIGLFSVGSSTSRDSTNTATTDAEGNYFLLHPPGPHSLRAWAEGYRSEWADYAMDEAGPFSLRAKIDFNLTYVAPILGVWEVMWTYDGGESCSGDTFEIREGGLWIDGGRLDYVFDGASIQIPFPHVGELDVIYGFFDVDLTFDEILNTLSGTFQYDGISESCRYEGSGSLNAVRLLM